MHDGHDGRHDRAAAVGGETLARGVRLQEFQIEDELGAGGFGVTYLAHDQSLGRRVAIKEYFPLHWGSRRGDGSVGPRSARQSEDYAWGLSRFLEEARVLAQPALRHPNLVQVYRIIEGNGTAYLVTEFVEGRSLQEALDADGPWREDRVRGLLSGLADGLSAVHGAGLLHRDIKPANVMLRAPDETPVLIDFGAARYATGEKSGTLTDVLTPGYAPFEQYHTRGRQGAWTDVYALGAVAYRALSGRKPDEAPARKDEEDPLRPVGEVAAHPVSAGLATAVDAALSVRASDRPQDLAAWRSLLESTSGTGRADERAARRRTTATDGRTAERAWRFGDERSLFGSGAGGAPPSPPEAGRRRWWYATAAVATVATALVLIWVLGDRRTAPSRPVADVLDRTPATEPLPGWDRDPIPDPMPPPDPPGPVGSGGLAIDPEIDLTRKTRQQVQRALAVAGFDPGPADGAFGPATQAAVRRWQEDQGEEPTGHLTGWQVDRLLSPEDSDVWFSDDVEAADDHGDDWWAATAVRLGGRADGVLEGAGDADWFSVSVRETGRLIVETTGATNTVGEYARLSEMTDGMAAEEAVPWYAKDFDSGTGRNFLISTQVRPGVYGVRVQGEGGDARGAYTLRATFEPDDGCSQELGRIARTPVTRRDAWEPCRQHIDLSRGYFRHYRFALADSGSVSIDLTSTNAHPDQSLLLYPGGVDPVDIFADPDRHQPLARDRGLNAHISTHLPAGEYAILAATEGEPRSLTLTVSATRATGGCLQELGRVGRNPVTRQGAWDGSCRSVHYDDGEYARYYGFTLDDSASVSIDLTSPVVDTWLALRRGTGTGSELLESDDDGGDGTNARITAYLEAGEYTIEATTLLGDAIGPFVLEVDFDR